MQNDANDKLISSGQAIERGKDIRPTLKNDGPDESAQGRRKAAKSEELRRARGAGEAPDGLTEEEREAQAHRVADRVIEFVSTELLKNPATITYVMVGTEHRMGDALHKAKASGWKNVQECEAFKTTFFSQTPRVYVFHKDGSAHKFDSASLRKVCGRASRGAPTPLWPFSPFLGRESVLRSR